MLPKKQGLYSPEYEHDNCGAGFICSLRGEKTNNIIPKALNILTCLEPVSYTHLTLPTNREV